MSSGFCSNKGLRQGGCESITLFKIFVDGALKLWKNKYKEMGIEINDKNVYSLQFADDQVVVVQDKDNLEYMSRKLYEEYGKWGMKINTDKTKYYVLVDQPAR